MRAGAGLLKVDMNSIFFLSFCIPQDWQVLYFFITVVYFPNLFMVWVRQNLLKHLLSVFLKWNSVIFGNSLQSDSFSTRQDVSTVNYFLFAYEGKRMYMWYTWRRGAATARGSSTLMIQLSSPSALEYDILLMTFRLLCKAFHVYF